MSASARSFAQASAVARAGLPPLAWILGAGLVLRLLFILSTGFHNDVAAFESWTLTLRDNPPWAFYGTSGFADYPPGYFVVLWVLAKIYALFPGMGNEAMHGYVVLRALVKLPAIAMDLVNAYVVYRIAHRFAAQKVALIAAAFVALNPAAIYVSSYWGQVDSVSWGLALIAFWLVLRAGDEPSRTVPRLVWAWLALAFSVLIKPQGATLAFLLLAYPFATGDAAVRVRRLIGTAYGVVASFVLAGLVGVLFHPSVDVFRWLFTRYAFGSAVYPYTSVNAFNLYALRLPFWKPDSDPIMLTVPYTQFSVHASNYGVWGVALVLAATALIVGRYLQRRDDRALLEGAMLVALAFFVLATRMHERYVYGAFLFAMPLIAFGRTGLWSSITLSVTMFLNLMYSLAYQTVMEAKTAGVDATNLWPAISHPAALANVVLFFWMGYLYLGRDVEATGVAPEPSAFDRAWAELAARARSWFTPREGVIGMTRVDWMFAGGIVALAFIVAIIGYAWPPDKIFDEVYFARGGGEYLRGIKQYEWTHPPFTKEFIAFSMLLFGGTHGLGDTSWGWRFGNVLIGAVECGLIYVFAKRLTGKTWLAALAGLLLAFDGFHYVESRIATGEILIATLGLTVLYALYRYLLAAQVRLKALVPGRFGPRFLITLAAGTPVAGVLAWVANIPPAHRAVEIVNGIGPADPQPLSYALAFAYLELGVYLLARWIGSRGAPSGAVASYADGTVVAIPPKGPVAVREPEGQPPPELRVRVDKQGNETYATPDGTATFSPAGTMAVDGSVRFNASDARVWLAVLAVALGLLLSSKWTGSLDLAVVWTVILGVSAQRLLPGRALYGNPRGFPIDVVLTVTAFTAATIYLITYIPFYVRGAGFSDLIALQQQMYWYHSHGVAGATHPYSSKFWQWPIMQIPISYYYHDFRSSLDAANASACCVAEILALPNPAVFLLGLISVPFVGWLAWRERNKGYALLVVAYLWQWLPYAGSPRIMWEYHFFPDLAVIVLCDVILIGYVWRALAKRSLDVARWSLAAYGVVVIGLFAFFYPVLAGSKVTYTAWYERMWPDELGIPGTSWIIPHRNQ